MKNSKKLIQSIKIKFICLISLLLPISALALTLQLPSQISNTNVVGKIKTVIIRPGQNFHQIARHYDIGYDALVAANPGIDPKARLFPVPIIIPARFVLPPGAHKGIVVNIAEMRLFYYPPHKDVVMTYPVGIGRLGEATPTGKTYVFRKIPHPTWHVPTSVATNLVSLGVYLPHKIDPGPLDPLGKYALRLALPGYLIHGTNQPFTIGTRASSGCIRMYPEDIKQLYHNVATKTPVQMIDQPYLLGFDHDGKILLEAHQPLVSAAQGEKGETDPKSMLMPATTRTLATLKHGTIQIDWQKANTILQEHKGIPEPISTLILASP